MPRSGGPIGHMQRYAFGISIRVSEPMKYYTIFNTPLCEIILAGNERGLSNLHLNTGIGPRRFKIADDWERNDIFFSDIRSQIEKYFKGECREFRVALNPKGTDFQKTVWRELTKISYGEVRTYNDIARAIGKDNASRAVGNANSRNPIPLIVPCHRVIGSNGNLTGFAHGLKTKESLLRLEGITL